MTRNAPWLWVIHTPTYSVVSQSFIFRLSTPKHNAQWPMCPVLLVGQEFILTMTHFTWKKEKEKQTNKTKTKHWFVFPTVVCKNHLLFNFSGLLRSVLMLILYCSFSTGYRLAPSALPSAAPPHKRFQYIITGARRTVRPTPSKTHTPPCHKLHHSC